MKDEDYLETKEFKNALKADQFHEKLAQALHKDKTVGRIFTMFSLQTFIDDVAEETRTNN